MDAPNPLGYHLTSFVYWKAEGGNVRERQEDAKEPNCVSLIYLEVGGVPGQMAGLVTAED